MNPLVSVVMSVYNNALELPRAMDSLLGQTYTNLEFVIVNDGSTDGSGQLLEEYARRDARIRILDQPNSGLGPSLNRACRESTGVYLARHDADDASTSTRIERQVRYMEQHPEVVVCGSAAHFVNASGEPVAVWEAPADPGTLLAVLEGGTNPLVHGSVMMRADAYRREKEGYRFARDCDDMDLWLRLSAHGKLGCLESVEYLYTVSSGSVTFRHALSRIPLRDLCVKLHAERRRYGHEISDWRIEIEKIVEAADQAAAGGASGETALAYAEALSSLNQGRYADAFHAFRRAASGSGRYALRARVCLAMFWAAPVVRWVYRRRISGTAQTFLRPLQHVESRPSAGGVA
jgi:glycosyltransferase involved in cell wall biosynthesis